MLIWFQGLGPAIYESEMNQLMIINSRQMAMMLENLW